MPESLKQRKLRREPQQDRSRASVERIAAAAGELLNEVGVDALTMRQIAEKCGLSVAAVYKYFPNKIDVLVYLADRSLSQLRADLSGLTPVPGKRMSVTEWFDGVVEVGSRFYRDTPGMARLSHSFPLIPELRNLEASHDAWVHTWSCNSLRELGAKCDQAELDASVVVISSSLHVTFLAVELGGREKQREAILAKLKLAMSALMLALVY